MYACAGGSGKDNRCDGLEVGSVDASLDPDRRRAARRRSGRNSRGTGGQFLTSDQLFDAFILQLGLDLAY